MKNLLLLFSGLMLTPFCVYSQVVNVSTANELQSALNNAKPGQVITLKSNTVFSVANCTNCITNNSSGFKVPIGINGTADKPIKLKGPKSAIVTSENVDTKYGLHLQGNNYWVIEGFTVTNSSKCVMLDSSSHNVINDLRITNAGYEALHLRNFSSFNTVSNCYIDSTGRNATAANKGYCEGIYIGSAKSNWANYSNGFIDTSNYNTIDHNTFGDVILSENIDIKEGTVGGVISNNIFNGLGCNSQNSADSYIDLKGDYYTVTCNKSFKNGLKITDGFQTHINKVTTENGVEYNQNFGDHNTFINNELDMSGAAGGYAINVASYSGLVHNAVCSNNKVKNAILGLTNLTTIECSDEVCEADPVTLLESTLQNNYFSFYPNPSTDRLHVLINSILKSSNNLVIRNSVGQVVYNAVLAGSEADISVSAFPAGVYFLQIGELIEKITIE